MDHPSARSPPCLAGNHCQYGSHTPTRNIVRALSQHSHHPGTALHSSLERKARPGRVRCYITSVFNGARWSTLNQPIVVLAASIVPVPTDSGVARPSGRPHCKSGHDGIVESPIGPELECSSARVPGQVDDGVCSHCTLLRSSADRVPSRLVSITTPDMSVPSLAHRNASVALQ
ncbi:hypothetical protein DAEQUDRAFT_732178 [Daedalea quercina L-15889]|uniref:Uncharacterized protein n=1 Tax=Daedalea quercina L-15889 TaxID=1314783 RepID=A0A165LT49_9APHY|nr:hypothetical protein DAEQUDRAFT_732178 [Daedalea quercina L-15889]